MALFDESKHKRGTGAKGGQFVSSGNAGAGQTLGYDAKKGTGTGYGTGSKGDKNVKALQTYLNSLGVKDSQGNPLKVDGKLGPRTTSAVKRLQRKLGLKADGLVTPALMSRIRQASSAQKKTAKKAATSGKRTVPQGARKAAVPAKKTTRPPARKVAAK